MRRVWMVFVPPGGVRRLNGDKLEFDDRLNEIAMFSTPQASRNELKLVPKRPRGGKRADKTRTESREENTNCKRASEERSGAKSKLPGGMALGANPIPEDPFQQHCILRTLTSSIPSGSSKDLGIQQGTDSRRYHTRSSPKCCKALHNDRKIQGLSRYKPQ